MNAVLKSADFDYDQLAALLAELERPEQATRLRCFIEAADGWSFDWWPGLAYEVSWYSAGSLPAPLAAETAVRNSQAGRLFAPDGELRWRRIPALGPSSYRCVFLGHADWVGDRVDDQSDLLEGLTAQTTRVLLWGQQTDASPGEWIELRIPHRFRYPIDGNPKGVLLEMERWLDATRQPHFIRLSDLHVYQETS